MAVIRQQRQVFNKSIGVVRANAGAEQVGQSIAAAADKMANIQFAKAAQDAKKKGIEVAEALEESRITTIDPITKKPEAFKAPEGFGRIAADAYQRVVDGRFEDSIKSEIQLKAQEIALKYEYNPSGYEAAFQNYLGEMSLNASGKYKVFIETNGSDYLRSTKLNITQKTMARARQQLSEKLATRIETGLEGLRNNAASGGFMDGPDGELSVSSSAADMIIGYASDGEKSFLLKGGARTLTAKDAKFAIAKGAIEYIIGNTDNPAQRVALDLAIRTNGSSGMAQLPDNVRDQVNELLKYVEVGSKDQLLQYSSVVAGDYNAQWEVDKDRAIARAAVEAVDFDLNLSNLSEGLGDLSTTQAYELLFSKEIDDFGRETGGFRPASSTQVAGSVQLLSENYRSAMSELTARRRADPKGFTQTEFDSASKDAREAILHNLIVPAAALSPKTVENLKLALTNPLDPNSYEGLTKVQIDIVTQITQSDFYKEVDNDFIQSTLNGIKNTAAIKNSEMRSNYELTKASNIAGALAASGSLTDEDYEDIVSRLEANIKDGGFTDVQGASHISKLNTQAAIGIATKFAGFSGMNSRTLNQLQQYVDLKGQVSDPAMFPSLVAQYGNDILGKVTTATELDAVVGKISGLKSALTTAELKDKEAREFAALRNSINGGSATKSDLKTRETVDSVLVEENLKLRDFNSFSPEDKEFTLHYIRNGGSEVLANALNDMADGQQVVGADSFITLYALLSTDLVPGRNEPTNQLEPYFNDDVNNALLKDAFNVYKIRGGNEGIDTIINELAAKRADPKAKANMDIILGTKGGTSNKRQVTPLSFAAEITGNDPSLYPELASVVEYFALTGLNKKQIEKRVKAIIDQKYPKSFNIIDTSMPIGSITRSRKAVAKLIPDDEIRQSFYDIHNDRLAKISKGMGMELRINDGSKSSIAEVAISTVVGPMIASAIGLDKTVRNPNVYLRPDPSGASDRYYFYYKDQNDELQALSYPADSEGNYLSEENGGRPFWYTATPDETIGHLMKAKLLKTKAARRVGANEDAADQKLRVDWLTQSSPEASADFMMQRLIKGFPAADRPGGGE